MQKNDKFDVERIRGDFPVLHQMVNGHPLVYVDNAATTQKPASVIDAMSQYYMQDNANVHRGVHALSVRATEKFEAARLKVQNFIHAQHAAECIFVKGATEAINLVANSFVKPRLSAGDEILITHLEHHANIVPWQMICEQTGAKLQVAAISASGEVLLDDFEKKLSKKTKFVSISHVSNALGTINPIEAMIAMAKAFDVPVLVDGAQAVAHVPVDVQALGCDFYVFSAHKIYGPTGVGVLWGKETLLNAMPPYQGGGEMISFVSFDKTTYAPLPYKFEAGTPNIAGVIGLGAALDYFTALDFKQIEQHEQRLLDYATEGLLSLKGFKVVGTAANKVPVISLLHDTIHAHDIGTILDSQGIALRSGHHCAMPVMDFYGVAATARISLSFYNTEEEVDRVIGALSHVNAIFA